VAAHARPSCSRREGAQRARAAQRPVTSGSRRLRRRLPRGTRAVPRVGFGGAECAPLAAQSDDLAVHPAGTYAMPPGAVKCSPSRRSSASSTMVTRSPHPATTHETLPSPRGPLSVVRTRGAEPKRPEDGDGSPVPSRRRLSHRCARSPSVPLPSGCRDYALHTGTRRNERFRRGMMLLEQIHVDVGQVRAPLGFAFHRVSLFESLRRNRAELGSAQGVRGARARIPWGRPTARRGRRRATAHRSAPVVRSGCRRRGWRRC
jgi:hypothetical protein